MAQNDELRRPIPQRNQEWAKKIAQNLAERKISPNKISYAGIGFAALSGLSFLFAGLSFELLRSFWLLLAACFIVLRLLCNMFDGMVAVEGGLGEKDGALWNELPDRIADSLILIGAGYGVAQGNQGGEWVGYLAAIAAIMTAYIREIGTRLGMNADFSGPFAKPQRMWVMIISCFIGMFEAFWNSNMFFVNFGIFIVAIGSLYTCFSRTKNLRNYLLNQSEKID